MLNNDTFPIQFTLPDELIAQAPVSGTRDQSRLLVVERNTKRLEHTQFFDITRHLKAGDLLVVNNSKVIPARLFGQKTTGGHVEVFLLRPLAGATQSDTQETWEAMIRFRGAKAGMSCSILDATNNPVDGAGVTLLEKISEKTWSVEIHSSAGSSVRDLIEQCGHMPIPPYIDRSGMSEQELRDRYQTIYASLPGSAAAPTAGLHFTPELLATLEQMGVERAEVTLHVGLGTFSPITTDNLDEHAMHSERIEISETAAEQINRAKADGRRVIAVGTTSVRVLESLAENSRVQAGSMDTQIFIRPGYQFQIIDGLITNFHLPHSTLLLLVAAFAGTDTMQHAYDTAITEKYRFYSFGDAMLIV